MSRTHLSVKQGCISVSSIPVHVTTDTHNELASKSHTREQTFLLYDKRVNGIENKIINSILHDTSSKKAIVGQNTPIFRQWQKQSDFSFGFIPHSEQVMPDVVYTVSPVGLSVFDIHALVRATVEHNYISARIPVRSQLNIYVWKEELSNNWDQQFLQLLEFGFPLDFNRQVLSDSKVKTILQQVNIQLILTLISRKSVILMQSWVPFKENPITGGHCSPFMTRYKPNSECCTVIIDLSWPLGASVNAGIDKNTYLGSDFELTFPSVDDITNALKRLGRGSFLYKVDVSCTLRHLKVDPGDYNLLGLQWNGTYIDTCLPFETRHRSQIFQCLSDAVRFIMRQNGHCVIDYIDDYIRVGVPDAAFRPYHVLIDLLNRVGLTISEKKLVEPGTLVVCLGVLIDSVQGTISIPEEKLQQVYKAVHERLGKNVCTKRQLQSILGLLLCWSCFGRVTTLRELFLLLTSNATYVGSRRFSHCTMVLVCTTTNTFTRC